MNQKFFLLVACMALGFSLSACQDKPAPAAQQANTQTTEATASDSQSEKKSQTVSIAVDGNYPPYVMRDDKGNTTGFEPDLISYIGEKQGFSIEFVPVVWSMDTLDGVNSDKYDLAMSGVAWDEDRLPKYELSNPHNWSTTVFITKDGSKYPFIKDINTQGKKLAVQSETYIYDEALKNFGNKEDNLVAAKSSFLVLQALIQGKADVAVGDFGEMSYYLKSIPDFKAYIDDKNDMAEVYGMSIVAKKGNTELIKKINDGLEQAIADGTYATIYKKWYGIEPTHLERIGKNFKAAAQSQ